LRDSADDQQSSGTPSGADFYGIPYNIIPTTKENKQEAEAQEIELLKKNNVDLIVLARYMQVLSADFIQRYPQQIINIHHSFLPAFVGAKPHHQAFERGVKLIGATAHYVKMVLSRAVRWHIENRILLYANKTLIFE
jgi:formyltetrahydrofolate deformylase